MANQNQPLPTRSKVDIITGHPDTSVKVALQQDDQTREIWLLVSVKSNSKPNLWGHKKVSPNDDKEKIRYNVKKTAEQIAVFQCQCYRDNHDFFAVGRAAVAAMEDVFAMADRASRKTISIPDAPKVG